MVFMCRLYVFLSTEQVRSGGVCADCSGRQLLSAKTRSLYMLPCLPSHRQQVRLHVSRFRCNSTHRLDRCRPQRRFLQLFVAAATASPPCTLASGHLIARIRSLQEQRACVECVGQDCPMLARKDLHETSNALKVCRISSSTSRHLRRSTITSVTPFRLVYPVSVRRETMESSNKSQWYGKEQRT